MSANQVPTGQEADAVGRIGNPSHTSSGANGNPAAAVERIYIEVAEGVRVPVRKINLTVGEPVYLYDTAGPQNHDIRVGLPPLRAGWIRARGDCDEVEPLKSPSSETLIPEKLQRPRILRGRCPVTQLHFARQGIITPEMRFAAARENREPEFVRVGNRPRPGDPPGQHQPSRERADDHRPQLPREGQRQHWQIGRPFLDRRRSGKAAMVYPLGRRHGDGPLHRREHPRHAASGSCGTRPCRSAPCRFTRPWKRSTARPRT